MFEYNKDDSRRNEILEQFLQTYVVGGVTYFSDVPLSVLQTLLDERFADPADRHEDAPTINEIRAFMTLHSGFTCHGYFVDVDRSDYRVSIEGVRFDGIPNLEMVMDFANLFRHAKTFACKEYNLFASWEN